MSDSKLTILPQEIYVGDKVLLNYSFYSNITMVKDSSKKSLNLTDIMDKMNEECRNDFTITNLLLDTNGSDWSISVVFIPWKTGEIIFPPVDLKDIAGKDFSVQIPSICVNSILEKTGETSLQNSKSPILIPGTSYLIYGFIFILFLLVGFGFFVARRIFSIKGRFSSLFSNMFKSKNYKNLLKKLKKIKKTSVKISDIQYAEKVYFLLKSYIEKRFSFDLSSVTTAELPVFFSNIFQDDFSENINQLYTIFVRLDFIRFSNTKNETLKLSFEERDSIAENIITLAAFFESGERNDTI